MTPSPQRPGGLLSSPGPCTTWGNRLREAAPRPHPGLLEVAGGGGITCYRACSQAEQTGPRPMPLPIPVRAPTTDRCWVQGG